MSARGKSLGSRLAYRLLGLAYRVFGYTVIAAFARLIAVYYWLFLRETVASSVDFYAALFPDETPKQHRRRARAQFRSFTTVFVDRFLLETGRHDRFTLTHDGLDDIVAAARERKPFILWMAHLGNWEVAAHCLKRFDVPLTLVIGRYEDERIEPLQRDRLAAQRVRLVAVDEGSSFGVVEVVRSLKAGDLVTISGDRLYDEKQRSIAVDFLGHECRVPIGPYVLAGLTGAPLVPAFGLREGPLRYRFVALPPRRVDFSSREGREAAMAAAAQSCFDDLAGMARRYPDQWYNFFVYWRQGHPLN
ncbi:MAG: lysophospholipid acyltransferase family protein [Proteobacteria bacterium]|jgi:predicted LPLAT superfamily acyltransferase|nr:lysophospholipid acyltransferase family protein [Pseudomonadota bacterium]